MKSLKRYETGKRGHERQIPETEGRGGLAKICAGRVIRSFAVILAAGLPPQCFREVYALAVRGRRLFRRDICSGKDYKRNASARLIAEKSGKPTAKVKRPEDEAAGERRRRIRRER